MMSARGAAALGMFFAWQSTLITSLFPASGLSPLSPQVALAFVACLTMVAILRGQLALHRPSSARLRAFWGLVGVTLGTLSACVATLVANAVLPVAYACSLVSGASLSLGLFVWILPLARMDARRRAGTLLAALAIAQVASFILGALPLGTPVVFAFVLCGLLAVAGLVVWDSTSEGPSAEVTYRPTSSQHYRVLLVALVLYAFVFGSITGTTSHEMTPEGLGRLTRQIAWPGLVMALAGIAALLPSRGSVRLAVMGRVLTPLLAILFLAHIVLPASGRSWLPPITLAVWQFVQAFVILLVIEISQSGVGSLGLVFSAGWSLLSGGFAVGCLFGSTMGALFGTDESAVNALVVLHTVLAIIGSSLMAAARYPKAGGEPAREGDAATPSRQAVAPAAGGDAASGVPADAKGADDIARACAQLTARHGLSEREGEVLELLARGNTRQSIATRLVVSENTVRTHVKNIYSKLHIHSKQQLIDLVDTLRSPKA